MLHNRYMPYNSIYFKPAPIYPDVEAPLEDKNVIDTTFNLQDNLNPVNNSQNNNFKGESSTTNKDRLSLFGLSLSIDDIIIIGIIIFLFMENKKDYLLIIILGLMFFDVSIDTFKNMNIFKRLFNPS